MQPRCAGQLPLAHFQPLLVFVGAFQRDGRVHVPAAFAMPFVLHAPVVLLVPVFDFRVQPAAHLPEHVSAFLVLVGLKFRQTRFRAMRIHVGAHGAVMVGADPRHAEQPVDGLLLVGLWRVVVEVRGRGR